MPAVRNRGLVNEFVGSARIFSAVIDELMAERLREAAGDKLSYGQLKLLKLVSMTRAATLTDVAAFLGVTLAAASKSVDRLVRAKLLRRTAAPADRRAMVLSISPDGRRLLQRYNKARDRVLDKLFGQLTAEQLRGMTEFLDALSASTVDMETRRQDEVCFRCGIHFRESCLLRDRSGHHCHFQRHQQENPADQPSGDAPDATRLVSRKGV